MLCFLSNLAFFICDGYPRFHILQFVVNPVTQTLFLWSLRWRPWNTSHHWSCDWVKSVDLYGLKRDITLFLSPQRALYSLILHTWSRRLMFTMKTLHQLYWNTQIIGPEGYWCGSLQSADISHLLFIFWLVLPQFCFSPDYPLVLLIDCCGLMNDPLFFFVFCFLFCYHCGWFRADQ